MALSSSTVWEVRITGSNTNGGGYSSGGTDYSQQDSAQLSVTDAACTGNTTVTSATGGFTSAMIGNVMYLSSGPGWYQITARTDTNTVTIDRNGPNASGMTANVGGALASLTTLVGPSAGTLKAWIKYGSYNQSTSAYFGGNVGNHPNFVIEGYKTTRGDVPLGADRPTITATAGSMSLIKIDRFGTAGIRNVIIDGNSQTSLNGLEFNNYSGNIQPLGFNLLAKNCTGYGMAGGSFVYCEAHDCGDGIGSYSTGSFPCLNCYSHDNTGDGFEAGQWVNCISANNGGVGFHTFGNGSIDTMMNCIAYSNAGGGASADGGNCSQVTVGGIYAGNTGYGLAGVGYYSRVAFGYPANTSGQVDSNRMNLGDNITLTADPFVDAANGDYNLNNTAGGGADLRAVTFNMPG